MKMIFALPIVVALLCQGCYIAKINGTEKLVEVDGRQDCGVSIQRIDSIKPQLLVKDRYCELSLVARGMFTNSYIQRYEVHKVGNQYRAIGFFPGYDYVFPEYFKQPWLDKIGDPLGYIIFSALGHTALGMPTLLSLFYEPFNDSAEHGDDITVLGPLGLIGTCQYKGVPYDTTKGQRVSKKTQQLEKIQLKGYKIVVNCIEYKDIDGIVKIPFIPCGEVVKFQLLNRPENVDTMSWGDMGCDSILQNDYVVHVATAGADSVRYVDDGEGTSEEVVGYIVQRGDYLAKISKKFNVTISSIKKINPSIGNTDKLYLGQKLRIPVSKTDAGDDN